MSEDEVLKQRLDRYSELFDLYVDGDPSALMVDTKDDPLGEYLQEVVLDSINHMHCQEDPIWREVFKTSLMTFFEVVLKNYMTLEKEHEQETMFINDFISSTTPVKQASWWDIVRTIEEKYSSAELNPYGFQQQLRATTEENFQPIFEAMQQQWLQASKEQMLHNKRKILNGHKRRFQLNFQNSQGEDYQMLLSIEKVIAKYPVLKEIIDMIGRRQQQHSIEQDSVITKYIPLILSHAKTTTEADGVTTGNMIQRALPSEWAYLSSRGTEDIFYYRFASNQLQQMASKPPTISFEKTEVKKEQKPRLVKGPIIVSVDTSGSMLGRPQKIAISVLMNLLKLARQQKRACYLITYSVRSKAIDLANPANWRQVNTFLKMGFSGGTDGTDMLLDAFRMLRSKDYSMADMLIISDFQWAIDTSIKERVRREQTHGTKFYGLGIGAEYALKMHQWLDKVWNIT